MKKITKLPYGIEVEINEHGGTISSELWDTETYDDFTDGAINAIESIILAHAINGIDIESDAYKDAIRTTVDGIIWDMISLGKYDS